MAPSIGPRVSRDGDFAQRELSSSTARRTFSIQSIALPSSLSWMAMWLIVVVGGALGAAFGV